jgi:hypothetical protein
METKEHINMDTNLVFNDAELQESAELCRKRLDSTDPLQKAVEERGTSASKKLSPPMTEVRTVIYPRLLPVPSSLQQSVRAALEKNLPEYPLSKTYRPSTVPVVMQMGAGQADHSQMRG